MALDFYNPSYMPVTCDLLPNKAVKFHRTLSQLGAHSGKTVKFGRKQFLDDEMLLDMSKTYAFDIASEGIY